MTETAKIVIPIHSFEPGGVERVALNLAAAWQEMGESARIVLGRSEGAMQDTAPKLDYLLEPEPIPTAPFETFWMIHRLLRYLRREPASVIFASGNTYSIVAIAMKLLLGKRCPPVVIKISNDLGRRDLPALIRWGYRRWLRIQGYWVDHFVGMAPPMRAEIAEAMGVPDAQISIIEDPALEEAQYQRLSAIPRTIRTKSPPHFLAIGRLAAQKNLPLLLRAFVRISDPAARLTILGEGAERQRLERLVDKLGIADRVTLPGHISDPTPWLAAASALVISSDYEGVPAVIIEALAAGLPVVTTDCSVSMPSLISHGDYGMLVPVGDEIALAAAMEQVLVMPFLPEEARRFVTVFRIGHAAEAYRALFRKLSDSGTASIE